MKTTTAITIVIILLAAVGLWWWLPQKENNKGPTSSDELQTYTNDEFGFTFSYPSDWQVFEDTEGLTPIVNVFPKTVTEKPPFIHHNNVTMVSVFPHGVPTEGIMSDNTPSKVSFGEDPVIAIDFLLENNSVWATYVAFGQQAPNWGEAGFIFGRVHLSDEVTHCYRDGEPVSEGACDPFAGDHITRTGNLDSDEQNAVLVILESFKFTKSLTEVSYGDFIRLTSPLPHTLIKSPLNIKGEARGTWFFEASFPIFLTDWDGKIIAQGYVTAQSDPDASADASWMTTEYVPFSGTLSFDTPGYGDRGTLILKKDNPSGLPEHDDAFEIPIRFR